MDFGIVRSDCLKKLLLTEKTVEDKYGFYKTLLQKCYILSLLYGGGMEIVTAERWLLKVSFAFCIII